MLSAFPCQVDGKWHQHGQMVRERLLSKGGPDVLVVESPWTEPSFHMGRPVFQGCRLTPRMRQLANIAFQAHCVDLGIPLANASSHAADRARAAKAFWVDLSQAVQRKPGMCGVMPTYTSNSTMYSFEHDAKMEPEEVLAMYGRPLSSSRHMSPSEMQDLVGNCMAAQPLGLLLHTLLLVADIPGLWGPATTRG